MHRPGPEDFRLHGLKHLRSWSSARTPDSRLVAFEQELQEIGIAAADVEAGSGEATYASIMLFVTGSISPKSANMRLVLGCIKTSDSDRKLALKRFSRSTR